MVRSAQPQAAPGAPPLLTRLAWPGPAQPARLPPCPGVPSPAAPGKMGERRPGGPCGSAARGPRGARLHSPRRPARRTRWPLPPALQQLARVSGAGQRLPPGPARWLSSSAGEAPRGPARSWVRGERRGAAFCQGPAPLPSPGTPTPCVLPGEAAGGPLCGGVRKGSEAERSSPPWGPPAALPLSTCNAAPTRRQCRPPPGRKLGSRRRGGEPGSERDPHAAAR